MNRKHRLLALLLALVLTLGALPASAFAAPASDIPDGMVDNIIVRALAYTGYNVQKQKDNGTLYQTGHYGGALARNAPDILSDIHYNIATSGRETVSDRSTVTGKAPNIASFEQYGLCCASFVTYFICNYLPHIEGADTQFITDAINATGMNSQAVVTWQTALNKLANEGKIEKVGTSPGNVDYGRLIPGDIIIFGNSANSHMPEKPWRLPKRLRSFTTTVKRQPCRLQRLSKRMRFSGSEITASSSRYGSGCMPPRT